MQILLTNDDGIFAPGLHAAWRALKSVGDVFVCCPDRPRSACSHQITMHKPLRARTVETEDGLAHTSNGTPADCVPLAMLQLMQTPPDLVVSGINLGPNLGDDVHYSGTVAGAMEGILNGVPAIAVSLADWDNAQWEAAAQAVAIWAAKLTKLQLPPDTFLNINVPNLPVSQIRGTRITSQGTRRYKGDISRHEAPMVGTYYWRGGEIIDRAEHENTDIQAVKDGFISVTPLHVDITRYDALDILRDAHGG